MWKVIKKLFSFKISVNVKKAAMEFRMSYNINKRKNILVRKFSRKGAIGIPLFPFPVVQIKKRFFIHSLPVEILN